MQEKNTIRALDLKNEALSIHIEGLVQELAQSRQLEEELTFRVSTLESEMQYQHPRGSFRATELAVRSQWLEHVRRVWQQGQDALRQVREQRRLLEDRLLAMRLEQFKFQKVRALLQQRVDTRTAKLEQKKLDEMALVMHRQKKENPLWAL